MDRVNAWMFLGFAVALCSCAHPPVRAPEMWPELASTVTPSTPAPAPIAPSPPVSVATATPPRFPPVGERRLPGVKLWLVEAPGTGHVAIRVLTRRGNDGAYHEENLRVMITMLKEMLEARLEGYDVVSTLTSQAAALEVLVRSADATRTLHAIREVLDGPLDEARASALLRHRGSLQQPDLLRPHLYNVSSEPVAFSTADALARCRNERFSSSDRLITLVGDFDTSEVVAAGIEAFSAAHDVPRADAGEINLIHAERVSVSRFNNTFAASLTLGAPAPRHPHYDVFNLILSMAEEPLPMLPSDNFEGPPPVVSSFLDSSSPGALAFLAVEGPRSRAEPVLEALFRYYRQLITRPFTPRTLDHARRASWASAQDDINRDPSDFLAGAFIRHLVPSQLEARLQALEELTPELLLDMTRYYFAPGRIILFATGPRRVLSPLIVLRNGNGFRLRVDAPAGQN